MKKNRSKWASLALYLFGFAVLVDAVFLFGLFLEEQLDWDVFFSLTGLALGFTAAFFACIYALSKKIVRLLIERVAYYGSLFTCIGLLGWGIKSDFPMISPLSAGVILGLLAYQKLDNLGPLLLKAFKRLVRTEMRLKRLERSLNARDKEVSDRQNS